MVFFGARGGPMRLVWAVVGLAVLALLAFVVFNLNTRLDNQQRANLASVNASGRIVNVNDNVTTELRELTELTLTAQEALEATEALHPQLVELGKAIGPVADLLKDDTEGAQVTNAQLTGIHNALTKVQAVIVPLVSSAEKFGGQGKELLTTVDGLVEDLKVSVESARTINHMLPLPG